MSTPAKKIILKIQFGLLLLAAAGWLAHSARAQESPAGSTLLWNEHAKRGQWIGFGEGLKDMELPANSAGMKLIVDWPESRWGVGALYTKDAKSLERDAVPLPPISGFHKVRFEVRSETDDGTMAVAEFVCRAKDLPFRAGPNLAVPVTPAWKTVEYDLEKDFPNMDQAAYSVDGLRILFLNTSKTGRNTVEFRNVTLLP